MKILATVIALAALCAGAWFLLAEPRGPQPATDSLSYALALARYEPLLALAGTAPEALRAATAELKAAREELAALQTDPEAARLIRSGLYPTQFLESLAALEETRQTFLRSGTADDGLRYHEALERALEALGADTEAFRDSLERAVPREMLPYQVQSGTVSRASILAAVSELELRMQDLWAEYTRRERCLYENIEGCFMPNPRLLLPHPSTDSNPATTLPAIVEEVRELRAELLGDKELLQAPIVVLEQSTCVQSLPSPHYFLVREASAGPLAPPFEFIGDILLQPIPPEAEGPVLHYLIERGAQYYPPSPVAFYQCPGVGSDLGRVFSALSINRELGNPAAALSESAALRLLRGSFEEENARHVELALAAKNRSARFDALVKEIAAFGKNDVAMKQAGIPVDVSPRYLLYVKSAFPSLYLGYNASVVGTNDVSAYESGDTAGLSERLVLWSAVKETFAREELLKQMRVFFTMHDDPQESVNTGE